MAKRTIVVGDIHGCYRELMLLLEKVKYDENEDALISAGDLVDRGPDSARVVKFFVSRTSARMALPSVFLAIMMTSTSVTSSTL